jgi:hypothetical protein
MNPIKRLMNVCKPLRSDPKKMIEVLDCSGSTEDRSARRDSIEGGLNLVSI